MRLGIYILVNRALRSLDLCGLDSSLELILCRLHQRRVESATHLQYEGTLGTCSLELLASLLDSLNISRDNELSRTVIVGRNDHALTQLADLSTNLLYLLVGQSDDSSHR